MEGEIEAEIRSLERSRRALALSTGAECVPAPALNGALKDLGQQEGVQRPPREVEGSKSTRSGFKAFQAGLESRWIKSGSGNAPPGKSSHLPADESKPFLAQRMSKAARKLEAVKLEGTGTVMRIREGPGGSIGRVQSAS